MSSMRLFSVKSKIINLSNKISSTVENIKLPEKYKGTIIEKWSIYWKNLVNEYKDVAVSVVNNSREKPIRATAIAIAGVALYQCVKNNPSEAAFIDRMKECNNLMILVPKALHRPESEEHLIYLGKSYNQGLIRRLTLGVVSFIWLADFDEDVSLYKAICPFLQPEYATFHKRIIDVGFWNKWWKLEEKMIDYDINF